MSVFKNRKNTSNTYFIAEIGSNFDGSLSKAKDLIWLAKECKAQAVKFQHYTAQSLVSDFEFSRLVNQSHQSNWSKSVFDTYKDAELNYKWTKELSMEAEKADIDFFTSPYSFELADYVEKHVFAFKIGSGDISWLDFITHLAKKEKPILLATGASSIYEVKQAVKTVLAFNNDLTLMQCNTNYSNQIDNRNYINLNVLDYYANHFPELTLGLSDHMPNYLSVLGAVAKGARVIEKHFTDSNNNRGPDHEFAMNPANWLEMIEVTRELEFSLGDGIKKVEINEQDARIVQRRSICAKKTIKAGSTVNESDFLYLRPAIDGSYHPYEKDKLIGKTVFKDVSPYQSFTKNMFIENNE